MEEEEQKQEEVKEEVEEEEEEVAQYRVVCYFTNWAWYRPGRAKFQPADIRPELCTHIVYGFAVLDPSTLTIRAHDTWADFDNGLICHCLPEVFSNIFCPPRVLRKSHSAQDEGEEGSAGPGWVERLRGRQVQQDGEQPPAQEDLHHLRARLPGREQV